MWNLYVVTDYAEYEGHTMLLASFDTEEEAELGAADYAKKFELDTNQLFWSDFIDVC